VVAVEEYVTDFRQEEVGAIVALVVQFGGTVGAAEAVADVPCPANTVST
jgi:hypothetical protein